MHEGATFRCAAAFVACAVAASGLAQESVPGASAEVVQLDVVVTDSAGRPVRDLTAGDFEVLEDGKPQKITVFLPSAGVRSQASDGTAPAGAPAPAAGAGTAPSDRSIAIVVDELHNSPESLVEARRALRRLPTELMGDGDSVALVGTASGVLQQFTKDQAVLGNAIERLLAQAPPTPPMSHTEMTPAQAELILRGDRSARKLAAKTLLAEPGNVYENTPRSALGGPGGSTSGASGGGGGEATADVVAEEEAQRQARAVLADSLRYSVASLAGLEDVVRALAARPGRKLCLLVSDGFLVGRGTKEEPTRELQRVTDAATRSGAVVYALDTRGLIAGGTNASVAGNGVPAELKAGVESQERQIYRTTLQGIADDTGGFLVSGTNDMAAGLGRMLADNAAYYLMAYEPTNTRRDGKFRKIKVSVRRPGAEVRTRSGYFARDPKAGVPAAPRSVLDPGLDLEKARAALTLPVPASGLPVSLSADFLELPSTGAQALVRAHVSLAGLPWEKAGDRNRATLELLGGAYDAAGQPVGTPFGKRAELDLSNAERDKAERTGLDFQHALRLSPGRYEVRMIVRGKAEAPLGGTTQAVEIPDLAQGKLAMSGIFAPERVKKDGSLAFQVYAYNVQGAREGAPDALLQAQIWSGGKAIAASKPQPVKLAKDGETPLPETNEMGLAGLEPGAYELRVVIFDKKAAANVTRTLAFVVE